MGRILESSKTTRIFILLYILGFLSISIFFVPMNAYVTVENKNSVYTLNVKSLVKPLWIIGTELTTETTSKGIERKSRLGLDTTVPDTTITEYRINFTLYSLYVAILLFVLLFVRIAICTFKPQEHKGED